MEQIYFNEVIASSITLLSMMFEDDYFFFVDWTEGIPPVR